MFLGGGSLSSPPAFSLAWLERRLPDGIPEPRVLCSRLSFPRPHWPCSPPYKVTTCQELLKAQKGHRAQSLRRSFPSPSPKGGRRPELKPQIPDPRKANRERVSSSKPLASIREDKQLSPLLLGLCLRHSRVGRSRGATKAGEGSGLEEPRQPPRGSEETPALGGRAPRPAPRAGRVPALARRALAASAPSPGGREGRGQEREEGRAAEGRRRCVPRLPKADPPLRLRATPPRARPQRSARAAAREPREAGLHGRRRRASSRSPPPAAGPCSPSRVGPGGSAAVRDRGEKGRTVLRAVDAPPGRDSKL
uniref:LHFPL tetraspan subfamily member 6 protein isoform X1 n=1 Tax=Tursiops truncatus TaxID=9739 RepID=A0A6J3QAF9_TURTR|nr:LHFPL tetraspan subfamily member 6 protein isoform X1 [Tursiops truncatus]